MRQPKAMQRPRASTRAGLLATLAIAGCSACSGGEAGAAGTQPGTAVLEPWVAPAQPAFRGALGYGSVSKGGRGGAVIAVTTLADAGPGSLRACIEASGPRVCVFRVSGTIRFAGRPPWIRNPFITIAGQTAPGGGITLAHGGGPDGRTPLVAKDTHDVIVRHLRIRNDRIGGDRGSEDAITYENSSRLIFDHLSASWARDEIISGYADNDHITISNSILAWGIPKHDKCALLASHPKDPQRVSFIGNLCAHNGDRNPDANFPPGSCIEIVGNVFYNAKSEFAEIWETWGGTPVSLVGNSFIAGPDTHKLAVGVTRQTLGSKGAARIYLADNRFIGKFLSVTPTAAAAQVKTPPCGLTMRPRDAAAARDAVLSSAGAWPRDALDRQVTQEVKQRRGRIVMAPGIIPPSAPGQPYPDRDGDGMDDRWEAANRANPAKFDAWSDGDGDGTANLDAFLDHLHDQLVGAGA
jgi:pectate lyase